jgi:hypothetical protein
MRPRHRIIRNLALLLLVLGGCVGLSYGIGSYATFSYLLNIFRGDSCQSNPYIVENIAHISLPSTAQILGADCGEQERWAEIRFDLNSADLTNFVGSTNIELPLSTSNKPEKLKCRAVVCGHINNITSYLYGTYSAEEWFEEIFIDTSNPSLYRVYFTLLAG